MPLYSRPIAIQAPDTLLHSRLTLQDISTRAAGKIGLRGGDDLNERITSVIETPPDQKIDEENTISIGVAVS